jgi:hypothetical protein
VSGAEVTGDPPGGEFGGLFGGLFDDAAMFPPADLSMPAAVRQHARHRLSWYADTVGPFVCTSRRLAELAAHVDEFGLAPFEFAAVVPEGIEGLDPLRAATGRHGQLRLAGIEVPLKQERLARLLSALEAFAAVPRYVEIPVTAVTDAHAHELSAAGVRLKLRTGGTTIDAFATEAQLAAPLVRCAAERLAFKCTAGLHNAVRHRDAATGFEHHGFLNVALAARVAAGTGNAASTATALGERDPATVAAQVRALGPADVRAVRAMFHSFGTCSIDEPIDDLQQLGLIRP